MKPTHLLILILLNVCWAASLSVVQALKPHLTYGGVVTLRFGVAALGLLALWPWLPGNAPRGADLVKTGIMGLLVFVVGQRLQVLGNQLSSAGNASVLMGLEPVLTSVVAGFFLREQIHAQRWVGFALGMGGILLLNEVWRADFQLLGLGASLMFVASFLCEAAYSVMGKPVIQRAGALKVLAVSLVVGVAVNLMFEGRSTARAALAMPAQAWLGIAFLALPCTVVGYSVWLVVIRETDVNLTAMTIFVQPVAGVVVAWLWLHERLHWGQLWGSAAIVAGLVIGMSRKPPMPQLNASNLVADEIGVGADKSLG